PPRRRRARVRSQPRAAAQLCGSAAGVVPDLAVDPGGRPRDLRRPHAHRFRERPARRDRRADQSEEAGRKGSNMKRLIGVFVVAAWAAASAQRSAKSAASVKTLEPTPTTVAYGYYSAAATPALRIRSGETVRVHTLLTSTPARLEGAGVAKDQIEPALRDIVDNVKDRGPGGHILTGSIFVEGAEPGDVLEVRIQAIKLPIPYAYNAFSPGRGFLPQDFRESRMKIIPLDEKRMTAHFSDEIEIPLRPFFGSMGVAPPPAAGRISSAPPGRHAGNLDNKDLVAGSTLYIPV